MKFIISYRPRYTEKDIIKMPYYRMGGGAGHFSSTITVPKYNGPSTHGYELLVNNLYEQLQMLFEEGNINGTARFNKMTQCLGGIAKTKWRNLIATPNYQPPVTRTNADFEAAFQDFTSKLHTNTYLGNDLQEATKNFEWDQMKTHEGQNYPDDITTQEARLAEIDDWAVNRCHFQGNPLDDAGKIRRLIKRLPQGYKRFLKVTRGVDPFDPVNPPTLEDLIELLDEYWTDRKEAADRESSKKNNKRDRDDGNDQGSNNKKRRHNNGRRNGDRRNGGGNKSRDSGGGNGRGGGDRDQRVQEEMPMDHWNVLLGGIKAKWNQHKLNPKSSNWDYDAAKKYVFDTDKDGGKGNWYGNEVFRDAVRMEKEKRNRRRGQSYYQQPKQPPFPPLPAGYPPSQSYYGQPPQGPPSNNNGQSYTGYPPPAQPPAPPSSYYQWHAPGARYGPPSGRRW